MGDLPWQAWLLVALLPLISTIVGGYISIKASERSARETHKSAVELEDRRHVNELDIETSRQRREDDRRWDIRIQEVASRFVAVSYVALAAQAQAEEELSDVPGDALAESLERTNLVIRNSMNDPEAKKRFRDEKARQYDAYKPVGAALAELNALLAELTIISPDSVGQKAQVLWDQTLETVKSGTGPARQRARESYDQRRQELLRAIDAELRSAK